MGKKTESRVIWTLWTANHDCTLCKIHRWKYLQTNPTKAGHKTSCKGHIRYHWFPFTPADYEGLDLLSLSFCTTDYQITITHNPFYLPEEKTNHKHICIYTMPKQKCYIGER